VEPVHVFVQADHAQDSFLVEVFRERELDQDPVHLWIGVQLPDQVLDFLLSCVGGQVVPKGRNADLVARLALHPHVTLRRRIIAHQHRRQTGTRAVLGFHPGDICSDLLPYASGNCFSIDQRGAH